MNHVASMSLGLVLAVAGWTKVGTPLDAPGTALSQLGFLPAPIRRALARALPWIEIALGGLLVFNVGASWVSALAVSLLVVFTLVLIALRMAGKKVRCACFGGEDEEEVPLGLSVFRNGTLLSLGTLGWGTDVRSLTPLEFGLGAGVAFLLMGMGMLLSSHLSVLRTPPHRPPSKEVPA